MAAVLCRLNRLMGRTTTGAGVRHEAAKSPTNTKLMVYCVAAPVSAGSVTCTSFWSMPVGTSAVVGSKVT